MAIQDMKGTVSTTGMVNNPPAKIQAPDMSKIKMPTADKSKQVTQKPVEHHQCFLLASFQFLLSLFYLIIL